MALFAAQTGLAAAPPRELDKADYADRLHAMFLAECMANWTGIKTEGRRQYAPFHTDADWGTNPYPEAPGIHIDYVLNSDPWPADDDTDIEYLYLHLLTLHAATHLTADQIRGGWLAHVNHDIWVSNALARHAMDLGLRPPATSFGQAMLAPSYFDASLMIDAQLTTEFFGALAPGMPEVALELADLPVRTTATGYAAHAAQFYIILYSLATQVDRSLAPGDQVVWLVQEARKFIPDTSKSADIVDFVLADYLANPDKDNWELTRDRIYDRYQLHAADHGFRYQAWYESSVNFACGLLALLYGELDLPKTVRIGALSGWDSDNGTATMGGLLGLIHGTQGVIAQFSGWVPSDRYWIARTRDYLPDYLPLDPAADDTLTLMAQRCMPIIDRVITESGGRVSEAAWLLAPGGAGDGVSHADALLLSPTHRETLRSSNVQLPLTGGFTTPDSNVPGSPGPLYGSFYLPLVCSGVPSDFRGTEIDPNWKNCYSTQRAAGTPDIHTLTVHYSRPVTVNAVRFIEGPHYHTPVDAIDGGWFESAQVELFINGEWTAPPVTPSEPLDPAIPFQTIDFTLASPTPATAIRITGIAGGPAGQRFITCLSLDALTAPITPLRPVFDINADGTTDIEDLYRWHEAPQDLDNDGAANTRDSNYLLRALRWSEPAAMTIR